MRPESWAGAWPLENALRSELPFQVHRWKKPCLSSLVPRGLGSAKILCCSFKMSQPFFIPVSPLSFLFFPGGPAPFTSLSLHVPKARDLGEEKPWALG